MNAMSLVISASTFAVILSGPCKSFAGGNTQGIRHVSKERLRLVRKATEAEVEHSQWHAGELTQAQFDVLELDEVKLWAHAPHLDCKRSLDNEQHWA